MDRHPVTYERVRELFDYNPRTGILSWRSTGSGRRRKRAGTVQPCHNGHRRKVTIDFKMYMEHRIIWLWMTGDWPANDIDHKDRNGINNRWLNLRDFTKTQNNNNRVFSPKHR